jgi:membrane protease YdiL (CAAX protease family)
VTEGQANEITSRPFPDLPPATWRAIETIPVFVLALVIQLILLAILAPGALGPGTTRGLVRSCGARFNVALLVTEAGFAASVLLWARWVSHARLAAFGPPRRPVGDVVTGVLTGGLLVVLGYIVLEVVVVVYTSIVGKRPPEPQQVDACVRGLSLAVAGPAVILAPPIGEELLFRGFLYRGLRRRFSLWPAALIASALFGMSHLDVSSTSALARSAPLVVPLFIVGMGLALIYERRQSLLSSMAAHAAFNLAGFIGIALSRR